MGAGPPRLHGARGLARGRRAQAPPRVEAPVQGAHRHRARARRDRRRHARCRRWLLRPAIKPDTLGSLVYYYLGETLPEPDPSQLVPETEAVSPATEAWYVLRLAAELDARLDEGSRGVARDIEVPLVPVLARMETQGVTVSPPVLAELNERLGAQAAEIAQRAYAEVGREVNLGSPKQLQELLFNELGMPKTRANKTGLLDRCRGSRRPAGHAPASVPRTAAAAPRRDQDQADRRDPAERGRLRRTRAHHLRADRLGHRPHLVERPEPAEHPGQDRGRPRGALGVPARRGLRDPAHRRLLADRDAHHGAPVRRRRPDRGVPLGGGPAPLRRRPHLLASIRPM